MTTPLATLAIDGASVRFGDITALDAVSLQIPAGALVGLIGPSGSGKTTTVRLLTGGLAPTTGTVRVLGEDPRSFRRETRRRIGYMPQLFSLYPDLTARENVDFTASLFGMLWPSRRRRVADVLRTVELWDARNRRASRLSGGMQRRLELAATLVHDPSVLFLDEPTAGLDPILRATIWKELRRLRDAGRTLLVTTQYVGEAEECDLVALVAHGRLLALDTPAGLRGAVAGGEQVELRTARPLGDADIAALPAVRAVSLRGANLMRVTVDSAATALPDLVAALSERGVEVTQASEHRPSFDEVFAALVTGAQAMPAATANDPAAPAAGEQQTEAA